MSQILSRWTFPLVGVSARKVLPRTSSDKDAAFELTGSDGALRGGLRPFPGFVRSHDLMSGTGPVTGFSAFEIRLDADSAGHGVAYVRGGGAYVDVWFPAGGGLPAEWRTMTIHSSGADGPVEAVTWGKVAYVLVRGRSPVVVRAWRRDMPSPAQDENVLSKVDPAGPGPRPRVTFGTTQPPLLDNSAATSWAFVGGGSDWTTGDLNSDGLALVTTATSVGGEVPATLPKGNYAFAYSFYDSRTGRRSQLSDVVEVTASAMEGPRRFKWEWHKDARPNTHPSWPGTPALEPPYAIPRRFSEKWDRVYLWRSVRVEGAGGIYVAAILHLDKIWPFRHAIPDPDSGSGTGEGSEGVLNYWYVLKDMELVSQDVRLDRSSLYETMPRGGTAAVLDDVMYVADVVPDPVSTSPEDPGQVTQDVYPEEALQGSGEIRWSQPIDPHPEIFHWTGRHMCSTPTERPLRLLAMGEAVLAMSRNRTMVIRRSGSFVVVDEIHEGYGLANRDCCAAVADAAWFLSSKGVKSVSARGLLSDVPDLDELVVRSWAGTLSSCSMAFDHRAGCLWILNAALGKAVILWMETGVITELEDLPFSRVQSGMWRWSSSMPNQRRALFESGGSLWLADHDREAPGVRTLKTTGSCRAVATAVSPSSITLSPHVAGTLLALLPGMWLHVESGPRMGRKARVSSVSGSVATIVGGHEVQVGDPLLLSPMVVRWGGGVLMAQTEGGHGFMSSQDMFRSKQLSSVGCVFDDVQGTGAFRGCAFYGTDEAPAHRGSPQDVVGGLPTDYSAFGTFGVSHSSLSPGVEVLCADLDFRMLSVICRGRIDSSDRAR